MNAPARDPIEALVGKCPFRPSYWGGADIAEGWQRQGWHACLAALIARFARAGWRGRLALWLLGVR